ncbi:MAG: hypothetical protein FD152_3425, partial [Xanthobacteraceae bacterium]
MSLSNAQRPVSSSWSSQSASTAGRADFDVVASVATTSARVGGGGRLWPDAASPGAGHISATVSDRS